MISKEMVTVAVIVLKREVKMSKLMKFENALVAMRKGYKIMRYDSKDKLSCCCYHMDEKGCIIVSHPNRERTIDNNDLLTLATNSILAEDWVAFK